MEPYFYFIFDRYWCHIGVSEGGLEVGSFTIDLSALWHKVIGIGNWSCNFYGNLVVPLILKSLRSLKLVSLSLNLFYA